jgi:ABC-type phosphate transport system permease subunit
VLASALEITFMLLVGGVTVLAGLFGVYVLVQLFRNPSRR